MKTIFVAVIITIFSISSFAVVNSEILKKASAGNLNALEQAYILHSKSDGAEAEDIAFAIGKCIRNNPKHFLMALKKNRSQVKSLGPVLGNLGADFVDDPKGQKNELEKRLAAIKTVKVKSLQSVRKECERELQVQIVKKEVT